MSRVRPLSNRSCPKTSIGSRSRRSPPSVRLAILVGEPAKPSPYVIRVKVPHGVKLMPHRHPEDRVYTVISGVFYIGLGDQFDGEKVNAYPPGSVIVLPGGASHFPGQSPASTSRR
jgi:quercetin dioxygenase-like cupin family protein